MVLLVTEEHQPHGAMTDALEDRGFDLGLANCGRQAVGAIRRDRAIDLLVAAMDLSDLDGITLAHLAQRHRPDLNVLLLCADLSELRTVTRFGLYGLQEPVQADVLASIASDIVGIGIRQDITKRPTALVDVRLDRPQFGERRWSRTG
jgi:DNA-binding NtrC family response regulator